MKKKMLLKKRMAALLCAVLVAVGCLFGGSVPYYALSYNFNLPVTKADFSDGYMQNEFSKGQYIIGEYAGNFRLIFAGSFDFDGTRIQCSPVSGGYVYKCMLMDDGLWSDISHGNKIDLNAAFYSVLYNSVPDDVPDWEDFTEYEIIYSSVEIKDGSGNVIVHEGYNSDMGDDEDFDTKLGYLQNLAKEEHVIRSAAYNYYNEDSRRITWTFDALTTSGLDLTGGNYSINHYQTYNLTNGYEDDDIIESSDLCLMGTYDAASLEFEYLKKDYMTKIREYGYDDIGFLDSLFGRFYLFHDYFQIVNNDTGEVGGYVKITPQGASWIGGENENSATTLTPDMEVDEDGYVDQIIGDYYGSGTSYEEAEENAEKRILPLMGIDNFTAALNSFSSSIENVPLAVKSIIDLFPAWILASFGLSFALMFLALLVKVLRG